ncbi:hypothetical protein [Propionivibrio limicola]|uniref:hypothetical protein n=1 Tax=Propionivibrio limicola TaxID=167645 RepID=UPI001291985A|nr:hypothetical protein [Propionivibrio limicola]
MQKPQTPQRPRLTLRILFFAAFDIAGMVLFATGAFWFAQRQPLFIPDFPSSLFEAATSALAGLALMFWSAAQILRELLKQSGATGREGD